MDNRRNGGRTLQEKDIYFITVGRLFVIESTATATDAPALQYELTRLNHLQVGTKPKRNCALSLDVYLSSYCITTLLQTIYYECPLKTIVQNK